LTVHQYQQSEHHIRQCCNRKYQVACAQSFAPWQQATIEIIRHNLSYYCLLTLHI